MSGGNNNLQYPHDGKQHFLNYFEELQLDIVGFLAILGEASVLANSQVSTLSKYSFLPRLLPAPQALIRYARPERLEPAAGRIVVVGSHSGNIRHHLNHVAHILHYNIQNLNDYSVRSCRITENRNKATVKADWRGPLTWLSVLGCMMSLALLILSIEQGDGMSLLATLLLSVLSTIIGIGNKWTLRLPQRKSNSKVPNSDVIIAFPHGAFLIVHCEEEVARQLYWAPEKCDYMVGVQTYRFIALIGTILLMFGVIALANATLLLQIAFAAAYIILNVAYWIVAALPQKLHWDLSSFKVTEECYTLGHDNETYTQALWQAIAIIRTTKWARDADVAPATPAWDEWLREARAVAESEPLVKDEVTGLLMPKRDAHGNFVLPDWDPQAALSRCLKSADDPV